MATTNGAGSHPAPSRAGSAGRPAPAATAMELSSLLATLLDALCAAELPDDAGVVAQHARAATYRLVSSLHAEGLAERPVPASLAPPSVRWRHWRFPTGGALHTSGLSVDIDGCCAHVEGRPVRLTVVQTRLIAALAAHPGRVVPYPALVQVGWNGEPVKPSALYAQMSRLRATLELSRRTCTIRAVAERGYRLEPPERAAGQG